MMVHEPEAFKYGSHDASLAEYPIDDAPPNRTRVSLSTDILCKRACAAK